MTRRGWVAFAAGFTLLAALVWSAGPYWTVVRRPAETHRSRLAHQKVKEDTPEKFGRRALVGAAVGFVLSLLALPPRRGGGGPGTE